MNYVFADTGYWIALFNPHDALHTVATTISSHLRGAILVSSDWVFTELLNDFSSRGSRQRTVASTAVDIMLSGSEVILERQSPDSFDAALRLYSERADKNWSLTDCASFLIMRRYGMKDALTFDRHFEQAGFKALLR